MQGKSSVILLTRPRPSKAVVAGGALSLASSVRAVRPGEQSTRLRAPKTLCMSPDSHRHATASIRPGERHSSWPRAVRTTGQVLFSVAVTTNRPRSAVTMSASSSLWPTSRELHAFHSELLIVLETPLMEVGSLITSSFQMKQSRPKG